MSTPVSLVTRPRVTRAIRKALLAQGWEHQDLDDGVQDVRAKLLAAFRRGARVPPDLEGMRLLAHTVATNHAIDALRSAEKASRVFVGTCDPDEYAPLHDGGGGREPIDARRQLELLAELFREGAMPEGGVDILEGVASGCTCFEVAEDLGISEDAVRWRLAKMRRVYRKRVLERGLWPGADHLRLVSSTPTAAVQARRRARDGQLRPVPEPRNPNPGPEGLYP